MKIEFQNVKIKNFLSIGAAELSLKNNGFVLVNGVNNCDADNATSNGVGKSSIIDSILWCLTGETSRGTKDVVNRYSLGGAKVELTLSIDKDNYKIIRCKEDKEFGTNLFIYLNGEDKSGKGIRDTEKILNEILPDLTASLLGSVILLGQGLPQRFTNNTPSGRKEVLEKLTKSDFMIADIKDKLSQRKSVLSEDIRKYEDLILSDTSKKTIYENQLQKLKDDKALLTPVDYDEEINKCEKQLDSYICSQIDTTNELSKLQENLDIKLDEYSKYNKSIESNLLNIETNLQETYKTAELTKYITDKKVIKRALEDQIKSLESVKDICPTCGQKLPDVHKVDTTDLRKQLSDLEIDLGDREVQYDSLIKDIKNKIDAARKEFESDLDKIKDEGTKVRINLNTKTEELNKYNYEINNLKLTIDKIKLNKENYEKQSKTIDKDIEECENTIKLLSEKILYNNINRDTSNQHLEIINKMLTLATRDFRGHLLSNIIAYINLRAKEYSREIFDTDKIHFELDGNNIFIGYNEKSYENLSGGEKQKVDLIIQFSIRDMLSQFLDFSSNILALDEIFDGLDEYGCQKVIDLISNKFNDVESIFIITHHSELNIPYDKEIVVVKNSNGISEIQ